MSLRVPFTYLEKLNKEEEYYNKAFSVVSSDIQSILKKAETLASIGKRESALSLYKSITFYYILMDYSFYKESWLRRKDRTVEQLESKFKVTCVRKALICLGKEYGINLTKVFTELEAYNSSLLITLGEFADNEFNEEEFVD